MKILYFSLDYTPHDHRFLSALSKSDHQTYYVRLQRGARQSEDRPVPQNIRMVLWKGGQNPFRWNDLPELFFDFRRVIREIQPDVLHAGPIQTCAFIAALSGFRPLLTMSWGFDLMQDVDKNRWMQWVTGYALKRSQFFISDANVTREKAVAYGMNPNATVVFPWGIDLNHYKPLEKSKTSKQKSFTVFCNRSWEPRYGVDVLAAAFVKVAQKNPNVDMLLLNEGSQSAVIRQILTSGGVLERVYFGGQVAQKDLPRLYNSADLYVSPSHVDGSSVSLMEAMACGMPCLVSDIPANKEWVDDGKNGWLFRDNDADDLAEKILFAMKNKKTFPKIAKAARATAEERADWKKNARTLMQTYEKILEWKK